VGWTVGDVEGTAIGAAVGDTEGDVVVGKSVGDVLGELVVGVLVGDKVGTGVGDDVSSFVMHVQSFAPVYNSVWSMSPL
jgi:hypothetical protein